VTASSLFFLIARKPRAWLAETFFDVYLGNFPPPHFRSYIRTRISNLPRRFAESLSLGLGSRRQLTSGVCSMLPIHRIPQTDFPYAAFGRSAKIYVGVPYGDRSRFPEFFSADGTLLQGLQGQLQILAALVR